MNLLEGKSAMKILPVLAITAIAAGCAPMTTATFSRGQTDPAVFARQQYECDRDARIIMGTNTQQMDLYESCMRSRGYAQTAPGSR